MQRPLERYLDFLCKEMAVTVDALGPIQAYLQSIHSIESQRFINEEKERTDKRGKLWAYGYRIYSQSDEDGIIAQIFARVGAKSRTFIEIGVQSGVECNTVKLLVEGWNGLWVDGSPEDVQKAIKIKEQFKDRLKLREAFVTAENINDVISGINDVDLLSIDIDFNDYWIWKAITTIEPRVVVIEYNALWWPPISLVTPYDPKAVWDGTNYSGASLEALTKLGKSKGYSLIGCNFSGTNAFFVRNDLTSHFMEFAPFEAGRHYEPIRFNVRPTLGHATRIGPMQQI